MPQDIVAAARQTEVLIANHVFDYLVDVDADNDIQPRLATEWTHSDDGLSYDLSDNHALIVKDGTEDATDFNGTGPFVVTDYQSENRIVMEANDRREKARRLKSRQRLQSRPSPTLWLSSRPCLLPN